MRAVCRFVKSIKKAECIILSGIMLCAAGCGISSSEEAPRLAVQSYDAISYEMTEVKRGDLSNIEEISMNYRAAEEYMINLRSDRAINQIYFSEGDYIKSGEVLARLDGYSETEMKIDDIKENLADIQAEIDHYKRLESLATSTDAIESAKGSAEYAGEQYARELQVLSDAESELEQYLVRSEYSGTIKSIKTDLTVDLNWVYEYVFAIVQSEGRIFSGNTNIDYRFEEGETVTVRSGKRDLTCEVTSVTVDGDYQFIECVLAGKDKNAEDSTISTGTLIIETGVDKDVLYVERKAVYDTDEGAFVFMVNEEGYRYPVSVELIKTVGDYAVISGENVTEGMQITID